MSRGKKYCTVTECEEMKVGKRWQIGRGKRNGVEANGKKSIGKGRKELGKGVIGRDKFYYGLRRVHDS